MKTRKRLYYYVNYYVIASFKEKFFINLIFLREQTDTQIEPEYAYGYYAYKKITENIIVSSIFPVCDFQIFTRKC